MEEEPNNKNGITKIGQVPWRNTKKLGQSKDINKYGKRSYKEIIQ